MNYWATSDPLFVDGHYVEDWELERFSQFSPEVRAYVQSQAAHGNKIESITKRTIVLAAPPTETVLGLPEGLAFVCPIQHTGTRVYDGDEEGVILHLSTGERIYPSGQERLVKEPPGERA